MTWGLCPPLSQSWNHSWRHLIWGARNRCGEWPEPSINNCKVWLEWWASQADMPDWWGELVTIPNVGDPERLAHKICTCFKISWVRCKALGDSEDYTMPPPPKCIQRKMFLFVPYPHLQCQNCHLKQPLRTLAHTQALQYWAEKANPPGPNEPHNLAMCVQELRWKMKSYMTFSDCNVFKGLTNKISEMGVEEAVQPSPTESTLEDDPAALMTTSSALADESAAPITTPSMPAEESVTLITTPTILADEPADATTPTEATSDVGKPKEAEYPKWIKVHLSHLAASLGNVPPTLGDLKWCHCNHSSSQRRAGHHLVEEQQALRGGSSSASPQSSLEPACQEEEDLGAQPKVPPLGFRELPNP